MTYTPNYGPLFQQPPKPDPKAAIVARDRAIEAVDAGAPDDWKDEAYEAVVWCAANYETFTVDQVQERLGENKPPEGRAMGAVMVRARRDGVIVPTGMYRPSVQPQCHANPRQVLKATKGEANG